MERGLLATGVTALVCLLTVAACVAATKAGGRGYDRLVGTKAADELAGLAGPDLLIGAGGNDLLLGGRGPDVLRGGPGLDGYAMADGEQLPAPGNDRISARDGVADEINCGGGYDTAVVDVAEDGVYNCERILEP